MAGLISRVREAISRGRRETESGSCGRNGSQTETSREDYETLEDTRSWTYVVERGEKGRCTPYDNTDIDFAVSEARRIRAERYIQEPLSAIEGDTIALNVTYVSDVKDYRGLPWHEDGQFAVVDDSGRLYGMIYDFDAEHQKLKPGDRIGVAVSRRPWTGEGVVLWSLGKISDNGE